MVDPHESRVAAQVSPNQFTGMAHVKAATMALTGLGHSSGRLAITPYRATITGLVIWASISPLGKARPFIPLIAVWWSSLVGQLAVMAILLQSIMGTGTRPFMLT